MNEKHWGLVLGSAVLLIGGLLYLRQPAPPAPTPEPVVEEPAAAAPEPPPPPPPDYPLPPPPPDAPLLPTLADSDSAFRSPLSTLFGTSNADAYLIPDMLIRRIVATIDSLPRNQVAISLRPFKRVPPPFRVETVDGQTLISPANSERYNLMVRAFTGVSADKLVALYVRWYPLFQRAYVELGYPDRSFNNRLIEVLDHLAHTPEPPAEIALVQPKVVYQFADPALEALSAGQKMLLRLSPAQRNAVKLQLAAIRAAIVAQAPPQP